MRMPTEYQQYLLHTKRIYREKGLPEPEWIEKAWRFYGMYKDISRDLGEMCSNQAISKSTLNFLENPKIEIFDDLPEELIEWGNEINTILKDMYAELILRKDMYFLNEWTLTKKGRKKMREYVDQIPYDPIFASTKGSSDVLLVDKIPFVDRRNYNGE